MNSSCFIVRFFKSPRAKPRERGAALLTVLIALMIITLILFELQYNSMIERKLAYNDLNQLQAYYLAKGAARIGMLRVVLYSRVKNNNLLKSIAPGINLDSYIAMIWQLPLPPFPPDLGAIAKLSGTEKNAAESARKETNITDGQSSHVISSEGSKINLNYLRVPDQFKTMDMIDFSRPTTLFTYNGKMLINLIEQFISESKDPFAEFGNIRPDQIVYNIMDWVNAGSFSFAGGDKDSFYQQQTPPYKAKRNRFFTLDELRLVKGISPALFKKLRRHVTVYSYDGKININSAGKELMRALYPDFTDDDLARIETRKAELGGSWQSEQQLVEFVSDSLGRSGFRELYNNKNESPLTVASESFLIDAAGTVKKSASTVQRNIRVAIALASGGTSKTDINPNLKTRAACEAAAGYFWDTRETFGIAGCRAKPTSNESCSGLGGSWLRENNQDCCKIAQINVPVCVEKKDKTSKAKLDKVKILYWSEN